MLRHLRSLGADLGARGKDRRTVEGDRAVRLVSTFEAHRSGWFWETDADGRIAYLSPQVAEMFEAEGRNPIGALMPDLFELDADTSGIARTLKFHVSAQAGFSDYPVRGAGLADGKWWSMSGRPVTDAQGNFHGFAGSGVDLTEKRRSQADITRLAYSDGLTGLANRARMKASLDNLLSTRMSGFHPTALLLLDLDRFKAVNDTLGHQTGDELLKQVAKRLQRAVGESGIVGRLGGDEFEVIVSSDAVRGTVESLAQSIIGTLSQPYFIADAPITIGCSIGVAIAPEHGHDAESLVRNADLALYAAKDAGRGLHRVYTDDLLARARHRKQMEDDLRHALVNGEMHVAYQPVVSTRTAQIVGYEALARWHHPTRGPVSPADFVPVAEECGLIEAIGEWVLRTAVADAAHWPDGCRVAVNVSAIQFANPNLVKIIANALAASGLAPERLELEITEGVFLNDDAHTGRMFKALKGAGVRLALDDFGTGYSSLGYLKNAPFDKIKIDQSFVRGAIMAGNRNAAIIRAIVTLADALGMETTAEGVEQQDEIQFIRELGCSHIQGWVYGKASRNEDVVIYHDRHGTRADPIGHKVSRSKRDKVLRSAKIMIGKDQSDIMIRNVSSHGAMIEGVTLGENMLGVDVLLELIEGQLWSGKVRWVEGGRAGLHLDTRIDETLFAPE